MKNLIYNTNQEKKDDDVIYHLSSYENTKLQKEYIVPANRSVKYSKLDKAKRKEEERLKKELKDYTKYEQ